jgi:vacuolar-type H+-ATPase subunit E/Vma4
VSEAVFRAAAARLAAIADGAEPERWAAAVRRLADEGLRLTGRGSRLRVRPVDVAALAALARELDASIEADAAAGPGVVAVSADGRLELDATVATRLDRARSRLADVVARRVAALAARD